MQSFLPDVRLPAEVVPSPNHGERRGGVAPDMLLLHYTGMMDGETALRRLCTEGTHVSAHYVVFEEGRIVQCVPEARRAWHAGEGYWAGATEINSLSIGIEIVNPGHDNGYPDFPAEQIDAVIALSRDILARHRIRPERVLAHSDIAPSRKQDPGEKFPWDRLHRDGVGHWVPPTPCTMPGEVLGPGDQGREVERWQRALAAYGYGLAITGIYGQATETVVAAFQRHFRPKKVDGRADFSTRATLVTLQDALRSPTRL
jgi:N-acetylmuramoyl-L-alanine amidase